jgi:hypothetical protein
VSACVAPSELPALEPGYEAAMLGELARILAGIPHELWRFSGTSAFEVSFLEG